MGRCSLNRKHTSIPEAIRDHLVYDKETGHLTWISGTSQRRGKAGSEHSPGGYITLKFEGRNYKAHRVAYFLTTRLQIPKGLLIDHINHIKGDNRWCNLRLATYSQNLSYRTVPDRDLPKGVYRSRNRYQVLLQDKYIGHFKTQEEAEAAYQAAFNACVGSEWNIRSLGSA